MSLFNITDSVEYDERIIRQEYFSHKPYASSTFNKNDEIRIVIQHQDALTLPCKSFIYLDGAFKKKDGSATQGSKLTRNALAFLFQEIRYELNGVEIDRTRNVGVTSTLKTYISAKPSDNNELENAGFFIEEPLERATDEYKRFTACIPLKMLMGYFEDMTRIIMNAKQELILVRSASDNNSYIQETPPELNEIIINTLIWKVPHISVADEERLNLLKVLNEGKYLPLAFRSWELYEYPMLPTTSRQTWVIKTSVQLETPRFIILAFQTNRRGNLGKDSTVFDDCKLTNAKVYLNSEFYPYDNLQLQWDNNAYSLAYDMYARFRASYYDDARESGVCLLSPRKFKQLAPIVVIDCSKQNEIIKSGPIDVRIEFESSSNFPQQTAAYALVLHDRLINYCPLTGVVQRIISS